MAINKRRKKENSNTLVRALVDESDINRSESRAIDHKTETNHEDPRSSQRTIIDSMIDAHYTHVPTA